MCGRFTITAEEELLEERYQAALEETTYVPHYNVSPSALLSTIILNEEPTVFQTLKWGIHPKWLPSKARELVNVRAETIQEKPTFKKNFEEKRCIIPCYRLLRMEARRWKETTLLFST